MTTTTEHRIYLGNRAKEVLENEVFIQAFESIEKEVTEQWTNSPARDSQGREKCWEYLMLLRKVRQNMVTTLETGKLAQIDLAHKRTLIEAARHGLSGWR